MCVKEELIKVKAVMSKFDEAVFFWRVDGKLHGILACHVDDFIFGGSDLFEEKVINKLKEKFQISQKENQAFKYIGLEVKQTDQEIIIQQKKYLIISELSTIVISDVKDKLQPLNIKEKRDLKGSAGQLNWISSQTRPDLAFAASEVNSSTKDATYEGLQKANKAYRKAKQDDFYLYFPDLGDISKAQIISFSDASFANLKDTGSQGGIITVPLGQNGYFAPLTWHSKKIKRVLKSTFGAETLALLEGAESSFMMKSFISEIYQLPRAELIQITCVQITDRRLKVDMCLVRDMLQRSEI